MPRSPEAPGELRLRPGPRSFAGAGERVHGRRHRVFLLASLRPFLPCNMWSMNSPEADQRIVRVRPQQSTDTPQGLPYFLGICETTSHARQISLSLVIVPPGAAAEPHFHEGFETAIYQLEGRVETRYGLHLERSVVTEAGDFLFIPPGVPHQALNLSSSERAVGLVARNDAREQESVVLYEAPSPPGAS